MMRYLRNLLWFSVGLLIAAVWMAPYAHAQVSTVSTQSIIQGIVKGTAGVTTNAVTDGVIATSAGQVLVKASGLSLPIPVSVAAAVERSAIARAAALCVTSIVGVVVCSAAAAAVVNALHDKGYRPNPDGQSGLQLPEQPGIAGDAVGTGYWYTSTSQTSKTPLAACQKMDDANWSTAGPSYATYTRSSPTLGAQGQCTTNWTDGRSGVTVHPVANQPVRKTNNFYVPDYILATEVQTQQDVLDRMAQQQALQKTLYDSLKQDQRNYVGDWPDDYNPTKPTTPVAVTAPPVTSPERTVSTQTIPLTDGTTETRTTSEHTTVSPSTTGTTIGDSKTIYPSQTVTAVTTVNNTTNVTNTSTTTTYNQPADDAPPDDPVDPCIANPTRAGCGILGDPPPTEAIPQQDVPVSFTPVVFASAASCPAPVTYELYGARSIPFQPFCDVASYLRTIFILIGSVTAASIFMEGFKA